MKISVRVVTRAKKEQIVEESKDSWKVYLRTAPERGRANERLCELVAERLNVPKSAVQILHGETSKQKLIEVVN